MRPRRTPRIIKWWYAAFATVTFFLYVNYLPVHLLTEAHAHDRFTRIAAGENHAHDPHHEGHDGHHVPHPASEHSLEMIRKVDSSGISVAALPVAPESILPPERINIDFVSDRLPADGKSPPQPSSPRAPPLG